MEHSGRLIGKQELMQAVWPDAFVTDDSLLQCTLELCRALDERGQQLLRTVARRGYLFSAAVIQHPTKPDHFIFSLQSISLIGNVRSANYRIWGSDSAPAHRDLAFNYKLAARF